MNEELIDELNALVRAKLPRSWRLVGDVRICGEVQRLGMRWTIEARCVSRGGLTRYLAYVSNDRDCAISLAKEQLTEGWRDFGVYQRFVGV